MEVGAIAAFIGFHTTLNMPNEHFEDEEKNVYTEYSPLGVCGGKYIDAESQALELTCPSHLPLELPSDSVRR
jgi:hypothetical protein